MIPFDFCPYCRWHLMMKVKMIGEHVSHYLCNTATPVTTLSGSDKTHYAQPTMPSRLCNEFDTAHHGGFFRLFIRISLRPGRAWYYVLLLLDPLFLN